MASKKIKRFTDKTIRQEQNDNYRYSYISKEILDIQGKAWGRKWIPQHNTLKNPNAPLYKGKGLSVAKREYNRYGIRFFKSYQDFKDYMKPVLLSLDDFNEKNVDKTIANYWTQYLKRDNLMASGQYQNYRMNVYRENYLRSLMRIADGKLDDRQQWIYNTLSKLTLDQMEELYLTPNNDMESLKSNKLPRLKAYYTTESSDLYKDDNYSSIWSDIESALKDLGYDYTKFIPSKTKLTPYKASEEIRSRYGKEVDTFKSAMSTLNWKQREKFYAFYDYQAKLRHSTEKGIKARDKRITNLAKNANNITLMIKEHDSVGKQGRFIRYNKQGNPYIKFVSSDKAKAYARFRHSKAYWHYYKMLYPKG